MSDGTALREIAAEILTEVLERGQPIHTVLFAALSKYQYLERPTARSSDGSRRGPRSA